MDEETPQSLSRRWSGLCRPGCRRCGWRWPAIWPIHRRHPPCLRAGPAGLPGLDRRHASRPVRGDPADDRVVRAVDAGGPRVRPGHRRPPAVHGLRVLPDAGHRRAATGEPGRVRTPAPATGRVPDAWADPSAVRSDAGRLTPSRSDAARGDRAARPSRTTGQRSLRRRPGRSRVRTRPPGRARPRQRRHPHPACPYHR